jgi:hypothetical protein
MAQFRPIIRQAFHFHYAPFESPPVLRRVTVNDDETHDYVSKQAYLTTKTNGVYVLYGHEMSTTTHDSEASKLYWQFEYLVDDRLLDGSGRIIEGEKILTPLTFSCTPSLLSPGQGRRNNIMHVFKKGVAPKLVSEKLQAPGTARPQNGAGNAGTLASSQTDAHISHFFSPKLILGTSTGVVNRMCRCPRPFSALLHQSFDGLSTGFLDVDALLLQTRIINLLYSLMRPLTIVTTYTRPVERRYQSILPNILSLRRN